MSADAVKGWALLAGVTAALPLLGIAMAVALPVLMVKTMREQDAAFAADRAKQTFRSQRLPSDRNAPILGSFPTNPKESYHDHRNDRT